jgi:hypothetical protein
MCIASTPAYVFSAEKHVEENSTASFRFNNENWFTMPHPKVSTFSIDEKGDAVGLTENGVPFLQYTTYHDADIRIQRFEIQDHFHYIINGEVAYSLEEISEKMRPTESTH